MAKEVLLSDGILDALVLDLQNRRATRANDLWLEENDGNLLLHSADTSFSAMLRRLTGGRLGGIAKNALCDWKYVEFLRGDPEAVRSEAGQHLRISRLPAGEIARLTDSLPYLHAAELITLLADSKAAHTLEAMSPERQLQVFGGTRRRSGAASPGAHGSRPRHRSCSPAANSSHAALSRTFTKKTGRTHHRTFALSGKHSRRHYDQ